MKQQSDMIYRVGVAYRSSCWGQSREPVQVRLDAAQLATVYTWVDTYAGFTVEQTSGGQTETMTTTLVFTGSGTQETTPLEQALMSDFAQTLFTQAK